MAADARNQQMIYFASEKIIIKGAVEHVINPLNVKI